MNLKTPRSLLWPLIVLSGVLLAWAWHHDAQTAARCRNMGGVMIDGHCLDIRELHP